MATSGDRNRRMPCPRCGRATPMSFVFPAERDDPCEELNAWRFQRCEFCGWTGDAATGKQYLISRDVWTGYRIEEHHYDTLRDWLKVIELC